MKLTNNLYYYPEKGALDCNTYLIKNKLNILIDPGLAQFLPVLIQDLHKDGIEPGDIDIITNTHLHIDHCWANEALRKIAEAKIIFHPLHQEFYNVTMAETSRLFGLQNIEFKVDGYMKNDQLSAGDIALRVIPSPGHSPDSVCFYCDKEKFLVCGDVIFKQNTGRIDFPGGDADMLKRSIEALAQLEIEYLLPGHLDIIIGADKVKNNFEYIRQNIFAWL